MATIYESELVERHNRLNDGMDALSRVTGLDFDKRRDALETLRAAREIVESQIVAERAAQTPGELLDAGIARIANDPVVRDTVTSANGAGIWHAVVVMRPGHGVEPAQIKRIAHQAIRKQIDLRQEAKPGWRLRVEFIAVETRDEGECWLYKEA